MKQLVVLIGILAYLTVKSFADPFWGVFMYYGLSVLRPQYLWKWALPEGIRWSLYAALVAIVTTLLKNKSIRPKKVHPAFIVLILMFGIFLFGSYVNAIDKEIAGKEGWEYAKIIIMLLISSMVINELRQIRYLALMIFWCFAYIAFELNNIYVLNGYLYIFHHGFGGYDNNGAALMIAMMIPFGYFFFHAERRWWRWIYLLLIILAIHVVMISYSRGAMLSALVIGIGMFLTTFKRKPIQTVAAGVVLAFVIFALAGPAVRARFMSISKKFHDTSAELRWWSWRAGWEIAKDYPMFGVGMRNSNLLTYDYGADRPGRTIHNVYIQIAADSGIPAALVYVSLLLLSFYWLLKTVKMTKYYLDDYELRWHHYICLASFWSLATFCFGAIFLSCEVIELCYLLMLISASAPILVESKLKGPEPTLVEYHERDLLPRIAFLSGK